MFHTHENQARFFITGNNLNRVGDNLLGTFEELFGVHCLTQTVRADDADVIGRETLQTFSK
ncbi:hypothetical protein D3C75_1223050 [compost metagenome]